MKQKRYYFVYETRNLINGKIYIGVHATKKLDGKYLGSGKIFKQAIKKYGKENFSRRILEFFHTYSEALEYENYLVDSNFVKRDDTYNICCGGSGGEGNFRKPVVNGMYGRSVYSVWLEKYGKEEADKRLEHFKQAQRNTHLGKKHSEEAKQKMRKPRSEEFKQKLRQNSYFKNNTAYNCWLEKYGKEEADRREKERIEKGKVTQMKNYLINGCKSPYDRWLEKYGKEEADRREKERLSNWHNSRNKNNYKHSEEVKQKMSINSKGKNKGRKPWNKGLTKNTDERLKIYGEKISKTKNA